VKNVPIFNYFSYLFLISSLALDSTIALDMQVTDRVSEFAIQHPVAALSGSLGAL